MTNGGDIGVLIADRDNDAILVNYRLKAHLFAAQIAQPNAYTLLRTPQRRMGSNTSLPGS